MKKSIKTLLVLRTVISFTLNIAFAGDVQLWMNTDAPAKSIYEASPGPGREVFQLPGTACGTSFIKPGSASIKYSAIIKNGNYYENFGGLKNTNTILLEKELYLLNWSFSIFTHRTYKNKDDKPGERKNIPGLRRSSETIERIITVNLTPVIDENLLGITLTVAF